MMSYPTGASPHGPRSTLTHAERAALNDTRELARRLRRLEADQRHARHAVEDELRREHYGHLPDGWTPADDGGRGEA